MKKFFFIFFLSSTIIAENYDNRIVDDLNTIKNKGFGAITCGGESYSNCGEDIKLNFEVATNKIEENLIRLSDRWQNIVDNSNKLANSHKPSTISNFETPSIESNILLNTIENNFYLEKQTKILDIEFDVLKLEKQLIDLKTELELIKFKGE